MLFLKLFGHMLWLSYMVDWCIYLFCYQARFTTKQELGVLSLFEQGKNKDLTSYWKLVTLLWFGLALCLLVICYTLFSLHRQSIIVWKAIGGRMPTWATDIHFCSLRLRISYRVHRCWSLSESEHIVAYFVSEVRIVNTYSSKLWITRSLIWDRI